MGTFFSFGQMGPVILKLDHWYLSFPSPKVSIKGTTHHFYIIIYITIIACNKNLFILF